MQLQKIFGKWSERAPHWSWKCKSGIYTRTSKVQRSSSHYACTQ